MTRMSSSRAVTLSIAQIVLVFLFVSSPAFAEKPTWSKKGVSFTGRCFAHQEDDCRPLTIPAPDGQTAVELRYRKIMFDEDGYVVSAVLRVMKNGESRGEVNLSGWAEDEVVWSPDSTGFFVNESDGGEGPRFVVVYRVDDLKATRPPVIAAVQSDMVASFPPCKAKYALPEFCSSLARHPKEINVVAVDWANGSSSLVVMAEVPCTSAYGGIMCQVMGYEVETSTGKILDRLSAKEFAERWQKSMAWKFRVPEAPKYDQ
jgi:hypothetical protein